MTAWRETWRQTRPMVLTFSALIALLVAAELVSRAGRTLGSPWGIPFLVLALALYLCGVVACGFIFVAVVQELWRGR